MSDRKTFLEKIHTHLFADEKQTSVVFTKPEQDMIIRYRAIFTKWLSDWHLSDKEMVTWLCREFEMGNSAAYKDIGQVKVLLGNVQVAGKEFQRFRATEMIMQAYNLANDAESKLEVLRAESLIKAAVAMAKIHKLGIKEDEPLPYGDIVPAQFETTGDVSVLGLNPIPNLKEMQARLRAKYNKINAPQTIDVPFEDVMPDE